MLFLVYVGFAAVLYSVFNWKCGYALAVAIVAVAVELVVVLLTGSLLLGIIIPLPSAIVVAWRINGPGVQRESHAYRQHGDFMHRVDVRDDDWSPPRDDWTPPHYR